MKIWLILISLVLSLVLVWAGGALAFSIYALNLKPQAPEAKIEAIVVLTGGRDRIEAGLNMFAQGNAPQLFITGVNKEVKPEEILALHRSEPPLPDCCITLGYKARSTSQNALETREWLDETGYKTIRLVTGNYHMPRAKMEMEHALPDVKIYIHPIEQLDLKSNRTLLRRLLLTEYHKFIYRYIGLSFGLDRG